MLAYLIYIHFITLSDYPKLSDIVYLIKCLQICIMIKHLLLTHSSVKWQLHLAASGSKYSVRTHPCMRSSSRGAACCCCTLTSGTGSVWTCEQLLQPAAGPSVWFLWKQRRHYFTHQHRSTDSQYVQNGLRPWSAPDLDVTKSTSNLKQNQSLHHVSLIVSLFGFHQATMKLSHGLVSEGQESFLIHFKPTLKSLFFFPFSAEFLNPPFPYKKRKTINFKPLLLHLPRRNSL